GDRRILIDLQEIGGAKVVVALLIVRANARRVDRDFDFGPLRMVGIHVAGHRDLRKVAAHRHHAEMLGRKLDLGVIRNKYPGSHCHSSSPKALESTLPRRTYFLQVPALTTV